MLVVASAMVTSFSKSRPVSSVISNILFSSIGHIYCSNIFPANYFQFQFYGVEVLIKQTAFPQNFHTRKLGETTVIYAVEVAPINTHVAPWCSRYHYCITSFNKVWAQILCRSWRVGDLWWWVFLTMVPAGVKV